MNTTSNIVTMPGVPAFAVGDPGKFYKENGFEQYSVFIEVSDQELFWSEAVRPFKRIQADLERELEKNLENKFGHFEKSKTEIIYSRDSIRGLHKLAALAWARPVTTTHYHYPAVWVKPVTEPVTNKHKHKRCEYCGTKWKEDSRGNCFSCGAVDVVCIKGT